MTEESHVLVIFPHPDDESFSSAGTLARYIDNGIPVTYACLTLGQMGRNLGNPPFATRESLPHIREKELENAMAAIGITDLRKMGLRDKTVEFEPHDEMDAMVKSLIDELQPSVIISFYPKFAVHPDHEATAEAVVRTVGRMAKEDRPRLQLVAFSNDAKEKLGEPDILNEISDYKEVKLRAFEAHASQTGPFLEQLATPDVSGQVKSFLEVEPYWTYNFES
ncbi:bacillithiol biosynthesis deacetylase BshB2 [Staphylococcus gallinarum]|jgi:bacillithiol biosynthesis deacetylase BshB2|uniref:Bacillithiol biosynthesis deacetylase BshB2 n=1 Tax=Staphylococcus gallinarum TaxID=1293 RepID=A0A2T4SVX7_STAGA|nr:bacillithiol biosynthesis deacetylase BshB2 [Staphylococcus gallinarum]MCD8787291.1 bacillithiol biosynthesis deacetylase BshB2 [Staphylococcus gallinarum]MCD8821773.1 bacillithiol biosynthesis deacetylase BshB2 [Staphylococcus gallinarum]MCD8827267.1 bacillithiol biosynthesis deacetylase BshB2 [Staphylococcus gallinarum]MCD8829699.1 bacillithiol biosynthesis deacetylase BshB2 [Staphylococcus gallinarum]MCD8843841.1 bacillithiol biosynthesis deacetylase BshB2 [Staphylococcus gallinarum]